MYQSFGAHQTSLVLKLGLHPGQTGGIWKEPRRHSGPKNENCTQKAKRCGLKPMDFLLCSNSVNLSLINTCIENVYYSTVLSFFIISISRIVSSGISIAVAVNSMTKVVMTGKYCPHHSQFRNTSFCQPFTLFFLFLIVIFVSVRIHPMTCLKPATLRLGRDKSHVTGKPEAKLTADPLS